MISRLFEAAQNFRKHTITRDPRTGVVTKELWYRNGRSHRDDGPAVIRRDALTGTVILESWWHEGKLHRDNGPAFITRDAATGAPMCEEWYRSGEPVASKTKGAFIPTPG
jgi:hypothetical protein